MAPWYSRAGEDVGLAEDSFLRRVRAGRWFMTNTQPGALAPREFTKLHDAIQAIGARSHIDYMACIKGVLDKNQRFAFSVDNFESDMERAGFKDGSDCVKVWLPE